MGSENDLLSGRPYACTDSDAAVHHRRRANRYVVRASARLILASASGSLTRHIHLASKPRLAVVPGRLDGAQGEPLDRREDQTMADFKFDKRGMADLEKHVGQQLKKVEAEANQAGARESTPEGKARTGAREIGRSQ